jgi:Phage portal protein.
MSSIKQSFTQWLGIEHKVPVMLENKAGKYITYGAFNEYPYYLLDNYRRSSKHNAIVNGKVNYIVGGGWQPGEKMTVEQQARYAKFFDGLSEHDDLNDITEKLVLDLEIFNGFAVAVTWNKMGTIAKMEHIPFEKIRVDKDERMFQVADWYDDAMVQLYPKIGDVEKIPAFDADNRIGKQLFYYRVYAAGVKSYPLPEYMGGLAWIEADVQVANFHNNNLRNNFWGGYLINFNNGIPTPEEQGDIERQIKRKFSGTDNAGRFVVTFNDDVSKAPTLEPLTPSDMDKQFEILNKAIQSEIFISHRVVNPMLFGVKTEGQLGGRQELVEAYELFKATYINDRVRKVERMINYLGSFNGVEGMELIPVEPITERLSEAALLTIMTPEELREKAGLPALEKQPADVVGPNPQPDEQPQTPMVMGNDNIKKLSGREYQNLMRIVRHYAQEKITLEMARTMLSAGFGLTPEEVNTLLGVQEQAFSEPTWGEEDDEDYGWGDEEFKVLEVVASKFGSNADDYVVMHSKPMRFDTDLDDQVRQAFAELGEEEKELDAKIVAYRKKNRDASVEEMAKEFGVSKAKVAKRVAYLITKDRYPIARAVDQIASENLPKNIKEVAEPVLEVRYKYAWAAGFSNKDKRTSREFCKVMLDLADQGKVYTRDDINGISSIMGYSVWNRRGGWYHTASGVNRPQCRHVWEQQLVIRKGNKISKA